MPKFKIGDYIIDNKQIKFLIVDIDSTQYTVKSTWSSYIGLNIWKIDNVSTYKLSLSSTLKNL